MCVVTYKDVVTCKCEKDYFRIHSNPLIISLVTLLSVISFPVSYELFFKKKHKRGNFGEQISQKQLYSLRKFIPLLTLKLEDKALSV